MIVVKEVLRAMPGGSGSVLARCDDGYYVIKHVDNPQGPNVLANELLGAELMQAIGLPTLDWQFAYYDPQVRGSATYPNFTPRDSNVLQFASRALRTHADESLYQVLPRRCLSLLRNRDEFLGAFVFDLWAGSMDYRQALYIGSVQRQLFYAVFLDQGHNFGGPYWEFPKTSPGRHMCLDRSLYGTRLTEIEMQPWISKLRQAIPQALANCVTTIPADWYRGDIVALVDRLLYRLTVLERLVYSELQQLQRNPVPVHARPMISKICNAGIPSLRIASGKEWLGPGRLDSANYSRSQSKIARAWRYIDV